MSSALLELPLIRVSLITVHDSNIIHIIGLYMHMQGKLASLLNTVREEVC